MSQHAAICNSYLNQYFFAVVTLVNTLPDAVSCDKHIHPWAVIKTYFTLVTCDCLSAVDAVKQENQWNALERFAFFIVNSDHERHAVTNDKDPDIGTGFGKSATFSLLSASPNAPFALRRSVCELQPTSSAACALARFRGAC
jgi:hypothetical protein